MFPALKSRAKLTWSLRDREDGRHIYFSKIISRYSIRSLPTSVVKLDNPNAGYFDQEKTLNLRKLGFQSIITSQQRLSGGCGRSFPALYCFFSVIAFLIFSTISRVCAAYCPFGSKRRYSSNI